MRALFDARRLAARAFAHPLTLLGLARGVLPLEVLLLGALGYPNPY